MSNFRHDCSLIPNGPQNVQTVLVGMQLDHGHGGANTFIDRLGRLVVIPRRETQNLRGGTTHVPYFADGYAHALWDMRIGSLLLGDDQQTLYRRDVDLTGGNQLLDTWHAISSIESEYHVSRSNKGYEPMFTAQMRVECSKLEQRVRHGIKFHDRAYLRVDGKVTIIEPGDPMFDQAYELTVDCDYSPDLARQATAFLRDLTVDEHSAQNLARMFATPLLEPYKHLTYTFYGDGGNGKGILLGGIKHDFPQLAVSVDAQRILGGRRGVGGFSTEQETGKLIGALWAFDEDADTITPDQMTLLKKISTGDTVIARRIGENSVSFTPRATFIIATNNPVITTMTAASLRRFVYVRMKDGRKPEEFADLLDFRREYGSAPFLMASCQLWALYGDEPYRDVLIGDQSDLSEAEQWIVDRIIEDGYAVSRENKFPESAVEHRNTINKLGLKTKVKKLDGKSIRVLVVADEQRFKPYRDASARDIAEADREAVEQVPDIPAPIEGEIIPPSECGFQCDYTPAGVDKVAQNWKRLAENPNVDTTRVPAGQAYAVVPAPGYMIIDMDMPKQENAQSGWDVLNINVGPYGTPAFPSTYLVRTPSGGVHAYYRMPQRLHGRLKNSVHNSGIPVDIRCERKGYVIGAGSHTNAGIYALVDVPERVPELSDQLAAWLAEHGYVEQPQPVQGTTSRALVPYTGGGNSVERLLNASTGGRNGRPDMTPIPEGQRNDGLYRWICGRLLNHPENLRQIEQDLYERGHASGLRDGELAQIWKSAASHCIGQATA
ncbi:bifunctional DNA primase/polymerase [Bifidobacterium tissieri]|uniref:bifunctional DNA primase/polymerase n=1 Tax=Bifidobacterium tissieri TaxID=1630162 RepID=UPI00123AACC8|nr:bifunctional DNA primase/polymerase [Bifidobacterium tissieri]KAA8832594.1 DNA primase [Bifidobacterium tissieri]